MIHRDWFVCRGSAQSYNVSHIIIKKTLNPVIASCFIKKQNNMTFPHGVNNADIVFFLNIICLMLLSFCIEMIGQLVPANSMRPVSISARMQPAAHMSMALV